MLNSELMGKFLASPDSWKVQGSCRRLPLEEIDRKFFPPKGEVAKGHAEAVRVCRHCPVKQKCLEDALETGEIFNSVRGGLKPRELKRLWQITGGVLKGRRIIRYPSAPKAA